MEHAADRDDKKTLRKEHPSGWFYLTQHDAIPILVDALLDLPPEQEFNTADTPASRAKLSTSTPTFFLRSNSSRKSRIRPHSTASQTAMSPESS